MFRLLGPLALAVLLGSGAFAQQPPGPRPRPGPPIWPAPAVRLLDRLSRMTPEERDRFLENLPPERRRRIERRLELYNRLSPEERRRLRERYQRFSELPPERQDAVRELFRRFSSLPPERRPLVRREFLRLRRMSEPERRARLNSPALREFFSPAERELLADMTSVLPAQDWRLPQEPPDPPPAK